MVCAGYLPAPVPNDFVGYSPWCREIQASPAVNGSETAVGLIVAKVG
jgi:hypothetical protein